MFHSDMERKTNTKSFSGFYRGEVVDVDDPMRTGRVRVRVFGVYDDLSVNTIPWSIRADSFMMGQAGVGGFFVPYVGSHVFVFFEQGDPEQPVYFAGAPAKDDGPPERMNNYPRNHVFKSQTGHLVEINDGGGIIHVQHSSGTEVTMNPDGSMTINVLGDITTNVSGDLSTNVSGNVTVVAGGQADVTAADATVNCDTVVNGDVLINGGITWTGAAQGAGGGAAAFSSGVDISGGLVNSGGSLVSNGITLEDHVHGGIEPGGSTTDGPQ